MSRDEEARPSPATFEVRERVRWADVDMAGIIYFGAYARFVEIAEAEFYRALGFTYERFRTELGILMPRVHLEFNFYKPALLDDELILKTSVAGVGAHSVRLYVDIFRAGQEGHVADATIVMASVDLGLQSTPLPEPLAQALRERMPA